MKDYRGQWVVLYFYPKDFTSGCTIEAKNFQRDIAKYEAAKAVVLGVSIDNADSHKSFCEKEGLSFKLLADTDVKISEAYGFLLWRSRATNCRPETHSSSIQRATSRKVFLKVKPMPHSEEVLASLAELQKK